MHKPEVVVVTGASAGVGRAVVRRSARQGRYLASAGYESQQTSEPEDPQRPHNLWAPIPGDHGAHGTFGDRAAEWSPQLWAATHRGTTIAALLAAGAVIAFGALSLGGNGQPKEEAVGHHGEGLTAREREELRTIIERPLRM